MEPHVSLFGGGADITTGSINAGDMNAVLRSHPGLGIITKRCQQRCLDLYLETSPCVMILQKMNMGGIAVPVCRLWWVLRWDFTVITR